MSPARGRRVRRAHGHGDPRRAAARQSRCREEASPPPARMAPGCRRPRAEGQRAAVGDDEVPLTASSSSRPAPPATGASRRRWSCSEGRGAREHVDRLGRGSAARAGRLRWMRSPRSTWARRSAPSMLRHVDQQAELDAVAVGEADLLEDPAVRRRLAGQRLAHRRRARGTAARARAGPPARSPGRRRSGRRAAAGRRSP